MTRIDYIKQPQNRVSTILTTSYVAGTTIDAYKYNQMMVYITLTKGLITSMEWKIEASHDNSNWYQPAIEEYIGNGIKRGEEQSHTIIAANQASATQGYRFAVSITDRYIRIGVKGTGVMTNSLAVVDVALGIN